MEKKDGSNPDGGVNAGTPNKTAAWMNIGAGLLASMSKYNTAKSNYNISKSQSRALDSELALTLTSDMTAAREEGKMRRENLERSLADRVLKNAISGFTMEGSASSGMKKDYQTSAEDSSASRTNLKNRGDSLKRRIAGEKSSIMSQASQSRGATRTSLLTEDLPEMLKGIPM